MAAPATFVCECGVRLHVFVEGTETSLLSCPNTDCKISHVVSGTIREVQVDRGGEWVPYDWKGRPAL
jgi:hypothetical protein